MTPLFPFRAVRVPRARRGRGRAGFTLLEVMLAATVLALAITTSITTLQRAFLALDFARKVTLAGQIMQSELEKMRLSDWRAVSAYSASADVTSSALGAFNASAAITGSFTVTRTVSDVHPDMKQISLTTTWKGCDGRVFSRTYATYYGREGLYDYIYNSY